MVSCETSLDVDDTLRDLERRYHSSGTLNLNERLAREPRGFGVIGVSKTEESTVSKGILVDSEDREAAQSSFNE